MSSVSENDCTCWCPEDTPLTDRKPAPSCPIHPQLQNPNPLLRALKKVMQGAPPTEPDYQDWGGDTERAENYGAAQEHWRIAQIARAAIAAAESGGEECPTCNGETYDAMDGPCDNCNGTGHVPAATEEG